MSWVLLALPHTGTFRVPLTAYMVQPARMGQRSLTVLMMRLAMETGIMAPLLPMFRFCSPARFSRTVPST